MSRRPDDGPASAEQLRRLNTARLLAALRAEGPASRAELAARTGLSKPTVGTIVGDLAQAGVLLEADPDPAPAGRGRPGRPVEVVPGRVVGVGLELNVDYVAAAVVDLAGEQIAATTRPLTRGRGVEAALGELGRLARDTLAGQRDRRVVGVTVAVPALVRDDDRTVAWAPNLSGVEGDLVARLAPALAADGVALGAVNDANCAAYAEVRRGAAAGERFALYVTGTVGVGAGVVQDGRLLRGASGFAGEVGHLPLGDPAVRCGCGRRGCWETAVGLDALLSLVGARARRWRGTPVEVAERVAALAPGDDEVAAAVAELGRRLGRGLGLLTQVVDPGVVVLGGYLGVLADLLLPTLTVTLADTLPAVVEPPDVRGSRLGLRAAALGAAEHALDGVFDARVALV